MRVFRITKGQKNAIEKPKKYNGVNFNPRQDINGDWFISEVEHNFCKQQFGWEGAEAEFIEPPEPEFK